MSKPERIQFLSAVLITSVKQIASANSTVTYSAFLSWRNGTATCRPIGAVSWGTCISPSIPVMMRRRRARFVWLSGSST
jgi:hypothetical protein